MNIEDFEMEGLMDWIRKRKEPGYAERWRRLAQPEPRTSHAEIDRLERRFFENLPHDEPEPMPEDEPEIPEDQRMRQIGAPMLFDVAENGEKRPEEE